jgi:hypothetical protein
LWEKLNGEIREYIRSTLLGLLASNESLVVKSSAHCISSIATIELPAGQWVDLIDRMVVAGMGDNL